MEITNQISKMLNLNPTGYMQRPRNYWVNHIHGIIRIHLTLARRYNVPSIGTMKSLTLCSRLSPLNGCSKNCILKVVKKSSPTKHTWNIWVILTLPLFHLVLIILKKKLYTADSDCLARPNNITLLQ